MGLSNSGSEFQMRMATEILQEMLYHGSEVYLDDLCVHGNTVEEFLTNLRKCFTKFRARRAKLHPGKSEIGKESVQMCGHIIDALGIHFSPDKLDSIKKLS
jgi:hypothetical protein